MSVILLGALTEKHQWVSIILFMVPIFFISTLAFSPSNSLQIERQSHIKRSMSIVSEKRTRSIVNDLDAARTRQGSSLNLETYSSVSSIYHLEYHNATQAHLDKQARSKAKSKANNKTSKRSPFQGSRGASVKVQRLISQASSSGEIIAILEKNKMDANYVNIASALNKCAQIYGGTYYRGKWLSSSEINPEVERDLQKLLAMAMSVINRFQGRQLTNIIWSLGKLKIKNKELMIQLTTRLLFQIDSCNPQELAMAAWGFASLRFHSNKLFNIIGKKIVRTPNQFTSQNLALIVWAFASNAHYHKSTMEAISDSIVDNSSSFGTSFNAKDLSMIAWGYVSLCQKHWVLQRCTLALLTQICEDIIENDRIKEFQPHDLAQLSLAYAHFGYLDEHLLTLIASESVNKLDEFNHQEKSNLAWAFARLYSLNSKALFPAIAETLKSDVESLKAQELANLAWAFVVMEIYDEEFLNLLFDQASRRSTNIADEELRQFHQAYLVLKAEQPQVIQNIPKRFLAWTKGCWTLEKMRDKQSSARHTAISKVFNDMGIYHCNEDENDIDIALQHKQYGKVAVEIDGPAHFSCNSRVSLGHTHLKHKILKLKGWQLVQIPYYEWDMIPFWSSMEKKRYIQRKLQIKEDVVYSKSDWSSYRAYPSTGQTNRYD